MLSRVAPSIRVFWQNISHILHAVYVTAHFILRNFINIIKALDYALYLAVQMYILLVKIACNFEF
jgi:hypothetical protein